MTEEFALPPDAVERLAVKLFGEPNKRLSRGGQLRFGRKGSVAVVPARGVFTDHEAGKSGGVLDMIVHAGSASSRYEAARLLEGAGEIVQREDDAQRQERERREERDRRAKVRIAAGLWQRSGAITGTVAEHYLRTARRIAAPLTEALRFNPVAPLTPYHPDGRSAPALVAAIRSNAGGITGAHVTYLRPDGTGKADLASARKMVGVVGGAHVPLIPGKDLIVGEGIESTLSAWDATTGAVPRPLGAAAALSAGGVAAFQWPAGTEALFIAPDRDPGGAGQDAATRLARRAHGAGLRVAFIHPPEGCSDWNDAARRPE